MKLAISILVRIAIYLAGHPDIVAEVIKDIKAVKDAISEQPKS